MRWFVQLLTWDGLLPAVVWGLPFVADQLHPGDAVVREVVGTGVPIVAFCVRLVVGARQIAQRDGPAILSFVRLVALCCGLVILVLIDTMMILSVQMGLPWWEQGGLEVFSALYAVYLALMMTAWIPSTRHEADSEPDAEEREVGET